MTALIDRIEEYSAMVKPLSMVCLVVMGLALTGCDSRESAWLDAEKQNTISAYETFVRNYPDGDHVEAARERIEEMKFASAKAAGAADDLEAYLAAYPSGRHADQAKELLAPLVFKSTEALGTVDRYEQFVARFPQSNLAADARSRIRRLRYELAVESATLAGHLRFLEQYPDGEDSDELRNALTTLPKWEESRKLGELVLAMSPRSHISFPMSTGLPGSPSLKTEKHAGADADLGILRQLLADGAVPAAVRVAGWEPGGVKAGPNDIGGFVMSTGSPGRIVPASQKGMTLLEYCKANKLDRVAELLWAHEASRRP